MDSPNVVQLDELLSAGFPVDRARAVASKLAEGNFGREMIPHFTIVDFSALGFDSLEMWFNFRKLQAVVACSPAPTVAPLLLTASTTSKSELLSPPRHILGAHFDSNRENEPRSRQSFSNSSRRGSDLDRLAPPSKKPSFGIERSISREPEPLSGSSPRNGVQQYRDHVWAGWSKHTQERQWGCDNPKSMLFSLIDRHGGRSPTILWFVRASPSSPWVKWLWKGPPVDKECYAHLTFSSPVDAQTVHRWSSPSGLDHKASRFFLCTLACGKILRLPDRMPSGYKQESLRAEGRLLLSLPPADATEALHKLDRLYANSSADDYLRDRAFFFRDLLNDVSNETRVQLGKLLWSPLRVYLKGTHRSDSLTIRSPSFSSQSGGEETLIMEASTLISSPSSAPTSQETFRSSMMAQWIDLLAPLSKPAPEKTYEAWVDPELDRIEPEENCFRSGIFSEWRKAYANPDQVPTELIVHGADLLTTMSDVELAEVQVERLHFLFAIQKYIVCDSLSLKDFEGFFILRKTLLGSCAHPRMICKLANLLVQSLALTPLSRPIFPRLFDAFFLNHMATLAVWGRKLPSVEMQNEVLFYVSRPTLFALDHVANVDLDASNIRGLRVALSEQAKVAASSWIDLTIRRLDAALERSPPASSEVNVSLPTVLRA